MWTMVWESLDYLGAQSGASFFGLFWVVLIFEIPHYTILFLLAAAAGIRGSVQRTHADYPGRISMVIAGHNEADAVELCVRGLKEQSRQPDEIIVVSDGSTDSMPATLRDLQRQGLIDQVHITDLRAGKSAATNLAGLHATGDILVNVDLDCSFDRDAIRNITAVFSDPAIGAVSGNLLVHDQTATVITAFQAIEYLISISLGKAGAMLVDQVACVSGAFGAFRREAFDGVGGLDVGGGEDLDITLRLRKAGWKIAFAPDAIAYTRVPASLGALIRQRFRWERDAVRLRYRKHSGQLNPFSERFELSEFLHQIEFFVFNVLVAIATPIYIVWLFLSYGDFAPIILVAAQSFLIVLDSLAFAVAALVTPKARTFALIPYIVGYSLFSALFMRFVRLAAYIQEWIFDASSKDTYVPEKVHLMRRW